MKGKGTCKHGTFDLAEGCHQCIEESMGKPKPPAQLVKVQYFSESTGEISDRQYTYFTEAPLKVGDIVTVPIRNTTGKAMVSAVDVDESEIAAFKDKVKTILPKADVPDAADAVIPEIGEVVIDKVVICRDDEQGIAPIARIDPVLDTKVNLCDTCIMMSEYPVCSAGDLAFGEGIENESVIQCGNYKPEEAIPPGGLAAAAQAAGAEVTVVGVDETPMLQGEDLEARGYFKEGRTALECAGRLVIATAADNEIANKDLGLIAKLKKVMGNKRKSLLDPLELEKKDIRATYDYLMEPILQADKIIRDKMAGWDSGQRRIRAEQEAINALRTEAARKEASLSGTGEITESVNLVGVTPVPRPVATDQATTSTTAHWTYEVVDFSLVPDAYKVIDAPQLSTIARSHHDGKPVPGVRFYNKPSITVRT